MYSLFRNIIRNIYTQIYVCIAQNEAHDKVTAYEAVSTHNPYNFFPHSFQTSY